MKITAKTLREKGACKDQVLIFEKEWGKEAEIILPNLLRAIELKLNIEWFAFNCLPAPIWERLDAETTPIWEHFKQETASIWERVNAEKDPVWEHFKQEIAPIWGRLKAETASIIIKLIESEEVFYVTRRESM